MRGINPPVFRPDAGGSGGVSSNRDSANTCAGDADPDDGALVAALYISTPGDTDTANWFVENHYGLKSLLSLPMR